MKVLNFLLRHSEVMDGWAYVLECSDRNWNHFSGSVFVVDTDMKNSFSLVDRDNLHPWKVCFVAISVDERDLSAFGFALKREKNFSVKAGVSFLI